MKIILYFVAKKAYILITNTNEVTIINDYLLTLHTNNYGLSLDRHKRSCGINAKGG